MNKSEVLDAIRSKVGAENLSSSYKREGCRVYMTDVPFPRVVVDADLAFPAHNRDGKRCDFILFLFDNKGRFLIAPIELKGRNVDASEAFEQLQQGADFAAGVAAQTPGTLCRPILFHRRKIHLKQLRKLNRAKVRFRGRNLTITIARCNRPGNLARALKG